ncbi:MAG: DNA starvation/stationary phase protection protein Dps [Planctomycetota bacterium]|jgi:starvation-inducible DNA-binding protein
MHPTRNDLSESARKNLVDLLQSRLTQAIDLRLDSKQAHWNVKGPHFAQLHELFDGLYDQLGAHVDDLAERLVQLGGQAGGTVQAVSAGSDLPAYPLELSSGRDHLVAIADRLGHVCASMRSAIGAADDQGDEGTADLFTGISRDLDKSLWMVEAHLAD